MRTARRPRALMGLMFFPRGGSAQVTRSLARELPGAGWDVTVVSGSVRVPGHPGDASEFFAGLDVRPVDMTRALAAPDPLRADPPLHPSYEDRPGAPDRAFGRVDDAAYEHQVDCWAHALAAADAERADVLHLHHLTPINEAAARVAPGVPVVGHLHGTELLMLEAIADGSVEGWEHAAAWVARMRHWAASCDRLVVLTRGQVARATRLLGVEPERCVHVPNGFDPLRFRRHAVDRVAHWRTHLVERPRGWRPGGEPGSVGYPAVAVEAFAEGPVLLYVGRFTAVKRIDLLIRAYARARPALRRRAPLVLLGGFPGEWEGRHPIETVEALGVPDVYLAGWHEHAELPDFYAASDVVVLPSVTEQFGQTLVEGMACGLPAIAVDDHGPAEIVEHGRTGWLVEGDDEHSLTAALVAAVNDDAERVRRGTAARLAVGERYAWPALAGQVAALYDGLRPSQGASGPRLGTGPAPVSPRNS